MLPAIASDTGEKIVVGVRDSSADLSDGLVISEFAFHFNWERDSDPSVNGYVASLEDEELHPRIQQGLFLALQTHLMTTLLNTTEPTSISSMIVKIDFQQSRQSQQEATLAIRS